MIYDLLKHSINVHISDFLDMYSNVLQPCTLEPTRIVDGNKPSLVGNIFTNAINKNIMW